MPLVLAMIIPKPLRRFTFPLMFIKQMQPPRKMQRLCNWLLVECETADPSSIFSLFNLIPNRFFFTANSFFLPKPVAQKNPNPSPAMAISSSSGSNSFGDSSSSSSPSSSSSLSGSSIDPISESREPTPEWDPIAAYEALAPLHWDAEEFDFGVVSEEDEPETEGEEDL